MNRLAGPASRSSVIVDLLQCFKRLIAEKRPLTGHGPYRHCEQNPKNSMQIRIIVMDCKFNCFFQRLIRILFLKPCTEHFPSFQFRDKSYRIWQIIFIPDVYIFYMFCKYVLNATSRGGSRDSVDGGWGAQLWSNIFND